MRRSQQTESQKTDTLRGKVSLEDTTMAKDRYDNISGIGFDARRLPYEMFALFTGTADKEANMRCLQLIWDEIEGTGLGSATRRQIRERLESSEFSALDETKAKEASASILAKFSEKNLIRIVTSRSSESRSDELVVHMTGPGRAFYRFCEEVSSQDAPRTNKHNIDGAHEMILSLKTADRPWSVLEALRAQLERELQNEREFADQFASFVEQSRKDIKGDASARAWLHKVMSSAYIEEYIAMGGRDRFGYHATLRRIYKQAQKLHADDEFVTRVAKGLLADRGISSNEINVLAQESNLSKEDIELDPVVLRECASDVRAMLNKIKMIVGTEYRAAFERSDREAAKIITNINGYLRSFMVDAHATQTIDKLVALCNYMASTGNSYPAEIMDIYRQRIVSPQSFKARRSISEEQESVPLVITDYLCSEPVDLEPSYIEIANDIADIILANDDNVRFADADYGTDDNDSSYDRMIRVLLAGLSSDKTRSFDIEAPAGMLVVPGIEKNGTIYPDMVIKRREES